jgi:hypothetical protein
MGHSWRQKEIKMQALEEQAQYAAITQIKQRTFMSAFCIQILYSEFAIQLKDQ